MPRSNRRSVLEHSSDTSPSEKVATPYADHVVAIERGLAVLEVIGKGGAKGNAELAEATGLAKSTVARITGTRLRLGFVSEGAGGGGYQIASRALALGYSYIALHDVSEIVRPLLLEIADEFPLAASLVTRENLEMIYLSQARSRSARLMINVAIGSRIPLATTAGGRAYLAACTLTVRESLLKELALANSRDWPALEQALKVAFKEYALFGYCSALNVNGSGINAMSTPLRFNGQLYSLTCAGPATLLTKEVMKLAVGPKLVQRRILLEQSYSPSASHRRA